MSVAKGDRKQGSDNLEVEKLAKGLCVYTIQICKNEKNFPKRDRWILTNEIVSCAVKAYGKIREANSITVTTLDDYMLRRKDQIKARKKLKRMEGLVEIAGDVLSLERGPDRVLGQLHPEDAGPAGQMAGGRPETLRREIGQ